MTEPTVSVIVTTLDEEAHIGQAIDSLRDQTLQDFEIVVVDGGSSDGTREIIESYDDPRITLLECPGLGRSPSLNVAIDNANGKYVANVDPDDVSRPERFERQVHFLEEHPEVGVVGTAYRVEDRVRDERYTRYCPTDDDTIRHEMTKYIPILHSGYMARRKALVEAGLYDASLDDIEDLDLWIRVAGQYELANLDEVLVDKVVRPDSTWHSEYDVGKRTLNLSRVNFRAAQRFPVPRYCYLFPVLRLGYAALPSALKSAVRTWTSQLQEVSDEI